MLSFIQTIQSFEQTMQSIVQVWGLLLIRWSALVDLHSKLLINIEWHQEGRLIGTYTMFSIFAAFYDNNDLKKCNIDATYQIFFKILFLKIEHYTVIKKVIKYSFLNYISYLMRCIFYLSYTLFWLLMMIKICYFIVNYFTQI